MIDCWIIEKEKEKGGEQRDDRVQLELPLPENKTPDKTPPSKEESEEYGNTSIIEL